MQQKLVTFDGVAEGITPLSLSGLSKITKSNAGFTLSETLIAMAVAMVSLLGLFASSGQAIRIIHSGKQNAVASQLLQQRIETVRHVRPWKNATTFDGVAEIVGPAAASSASFSSATETFEIAPYPAGGTPLVIRRAPNGDLTCTGPDYASEKCVKFTATVTWTGYGKLQRTRKLTTILSKGGL